MKFKAILLLIFICSCYLAEAQESYRRLVNFEWEHIEGASAYDLELTQVLSNDQKGSTYTFKRKTAEWSGKLTPGKYKMILRARDHRGVPGEWSEPSDFLVGLDPVKLVQPTPNQKIISKFSTEQDVEFKWQPVAGASKYIVSLRDQNGKVLHEETTKQVSFKKEVPVASNYEFRVQAIDEKGIQSDGVSFAQFEIWGAPLRAPELKKPDSNFVRTLEWKSDNFHQNNEIVLFKQNPTTKKWEKFQHFKDQNTSALDFDENWNGGKYQLWVRSKADKRPSSEYAKMNFDVVNGSRSPAAEYTALVRKSIERVTGWYGIASYLVTQIQYQGTNRDKATEARYNAVGGTGRLGLGWYLPENNWGFLGIIDLSGFTINNKVNTYASAEGNAVYKKSVGDRGEYRLQIGGYYKEIPETLGDFATDTSESTKIKSIGPHFGAEYWYSLSPKLGLQVNAHGYYSLVKIETPNGQPINASLSTQFGVMGSYRFSNQFTGLVGYARRSDVMSYKANPSATTYSVDGDVNTTTVIGDYLNFYAEYNF